MPREKEAGAAGLGLALWALGVGIVRAVPQAVGGGFGTIISYALQVPAGFVTGELFQRVLKPEKGEILRLISIGCATALLVDGVVISFCPKIYRGWSKDSQIVGGTLLWAVGWVLVDALRRDEAA